MASYTNNEELLQEIQKCIDVQFQNYFNKGVFTIIRNPVSSELAYEKTEKLLKNYVGFKRVIEDKLDTITDLRTFGKKRDTSLNMTFALNYGADGIQTMEEETESSISYIKEEITWMESILWKIDKALDWLQKEEPARYTLITKYYFDNERFESLAESFGVSKPTILNWKKPLVTKLSLYLFPKDVIKELMEE